MKIPRAQSPRPVLLDELIMGILSWVPVKPLMRLRCVCKSWKSFISDPSFVKLHLQRSPKNAILVLMSEDVMDDFRALSCPVRSLLENPSSTIAQDGCLGLKGKYWIVGCCNGLVCLLRPLMRRAHKEFWVRFWNPATRLRSEKSPRLLVDSSHQFGFTKFAFGYDNCSDTYKVVAVRVDRKAKEDSQRTHVKVHSMGDNCWRSIESFPAVPIMGLGRSDGVYLSGTLNWLALANSGSGTDYEWNTVTIDHLVIVSLDLGNETSRQLLLPHGLDEVPHEEPAIGVLMDCLCFSHDCKRTHFVVWQMREFGVEKSWTRLVKVSYEDLQIPCLEFSSLLPLCVSENGDVLIMANSDESQAILYNWRDNEVERTEIPNNISWMDAKDHVESLVSPCCN